MAQEVEDIEAAYGKDRILNEKLQRLRDETKYRLNGSICPRCLAEDVEVRLLLNCDDYFECKRCSMIFQTGFPHKEIQLGGKRGKGLFKERQDNWDHLFRDILVLVRQGDDIRTFKDGRELLDFVAEMESRGSEAKGETGGAKSILKTD